MAKFNITISPTLKDLPHFPLADLVEFQGELKDLDNKRYNRLKKSIKDKGLFIPFFVWQCEADNTIYILDGHQRKRVLSKEGFSGNVPCVVIEADNEIDAKERLLVISSQYGKITQEGFDAFTYDLDTSFIQDTTYFDGLPFVYGDFDIAPLDDLEDEQEPQDSEPQIDKAKELAEKWGVQLGQLWILPSRDGKGEHRLLCGDSTKEGDIRAVTGGAKAEMVFTDPPYRMDATGGSSQPIGRAAAKLGDKIEHLCDFDPAPFLSVLPLVFDENKLNAYIFCNKDLIPDYLNWAIEKGYSFNVLFWKKPSSIPLGGQHRPDVEYLLFFRKSATWNNALDGVNYSKCLEFGRENGFHPTMKPVELVVNEIKISSSKGGAIFEPFLGSGTTLIACENTGRYCRAIEISPGYVAVALQRYLDTFGIEATCQTTNQNQTNQS